MNKENWINEVLESTRGLERPEANPYLYDKLMHRIREEKSSGRESRNLLPGWALTLSAFVLLINLYSFNRLVQEKNREGKEKALAALSAEMGLTATDNY